ncbi:MAG: transglycosylase SLT domain-containing protein [Minisyncoccia bacterium]
MTPKQEDLSKLEKLEAIPEPEPTPTIQKIETPVRVANSAKSDIKEQVRAIASEHGWGDGKQWEALDWIIQKESSWNPNAQNPKSTAFGLFQWLDMTRKAYNCPKTADVAIQTECGIKYIKARYGDPVEAKKFHQAKGWY